MEIIRSHYPTPGRELGATWAAALEDEETASERFPGLVLPLPEPRVAAHYPWGSLRWMNVLNYQPWTLPRDGTVAGLLPPELGDVTELLGHYAKPMVRAAREGLLVPGGVPRDHLDFAPPSGQEVLSQLLVGDPAGARLTEPGRIALQMIKQMRGLFAVSLLQREQLVDLLNKAADGELTADDGTTARSRPKVRFIRYPDLWEVVNRIHGDNPRARGNLMRGLTERDVLRAGLHLDCSSCAYPNWVELADIDREIKCERCLERFPFPQSSPPDRKHWAYRPTGAFSVADHAQGAYTVAFALRFLTGGMVRGRSTWCTAIELDTTTEIDFAVLLEDHRYENDGGIDLLLGEAKSKGRFEPRDIARAERLRERYPDAVLVFATLGGSLTDEEKRGIGKLAQPSVENEKDIRWEPSMVVLTATELFSNEGPPGCWRDGGGRAAELAHNAARFVRHEVSAWADITQQLHLDLEPHHEWVEAQITRIRASRPR